MAWDGRDQRTCGGVRGGRLNLAALAVFLVQYSFQLSTTSHPRHEAELPCILSLGDYLTAERLILNAASLLQLRSRLRSATVVCGLLASTALDKTREMMTMLKTPRRLYSLYVTQMHDLEDVDAMCPPRLYMEVVL